MESINDLILTDEQTERIEQIYPPSQPQGQTPAEHAVTRRFTAVVLPSSLDYNPPRFSLSPLDGVVPLERA
jgi:hypothetical protein